MIESVLESIAKMTSEMMVLAERVTTLEQKVETLMSQGSETVEAEESME
jgi:hypothetical protein